MANWCRSSRANGCQEFGVCAFRIPTFRNAALKNIGFRVHAVGDSYNDTTMLEEADKGILFRCPDNVAEEFPQFDRTDAYDELLVLLEL